MGPAFGESLSMLPLILHLKKEKPDLHILVTTGTVTSAKLMQQQLPKNVIHQYVPIDHPLYVKRFLDHWRPDEGLWFESELWPNLILASFKRGVKLFLINGRISDKTFYKWKKFPKTISSLLSKFTLCFGQTKKDTKRLKDLGAKKTIYAGNLKFASLPLIPDMNALDPLKKQIGGRPIWLAVSTHKGEEEKIILTHQLLQKKFKNILTLLAPRHPNRALEIADLIRNKNLSLSMRSKKEMIKKDTDFYLIDTLGELGTFYTLSDFVFIGGSFIPWGGHNPIEPAHLNTVIFSGPHVHNFSEVFDQMKQQDAVIFAQNEKELAAKLIPLFNNKEKTKLYQKRAQKFANSQKDVLDHLYQHLKKVL